MLSINNQAYVFLTIVYVGFLTGFIYDFFRAAREIFRPKKTSTAVMDVIFWVITAIVFFLVVFYANDGQIRSFMFLGIVLGWLLYVLVLTRFILGILKELMKLIKKVIQLVLKVICMPFKLLLVMRRKIIMKTGKIKKRFKQFIKKNKEIDKQQ